MCEYDVKVTAEMKSWEEEKEQQLDSKEDLKSSQTTSGKDTGKAAKDTKKLSPKSPTKKKGIWNADFVLEVLEITEM